MTDGLVAAIDEFVQAFPAPMRPALRLKLLKLIQAVLKECRP